MRKRIEMSQEWHRTEHQWSASLKIFWMTVGVICEWFIKALELKVNTLTFRRWVNSVLHCRVWTCDLSRIKVSFITIGEDNGGPPQQPSHWETANWGATKLIDIFTRWNKIVIDIRQNTVVCWRAIWHKKRAETWNGLDWLLHATNSKGELF